jgi:uncharacterized protein (UPF0333 family)
MLSLEFLLIFLGVISVLILMVPVFGNLKEISDKSIEKVNLENTMNQLIYFCQKTNFIDYQQFELEFVTQIDISSNDNILEIKTQNFNQTHEFGCQIQESLGKGNYHFEANQKHFVSS